MMIYSATKSSSSNNYNHLPGHLSVSVWLLAESLKNSPNWQVPRAQKAFGISLISSGLLSADSAGLLGGRLAEGERERKVSNLRKKRQVSSGEKETQVKRDRQVY